MTMIVRSLREGHRFSVTTGKLSSTGKQVAIRPVQPLVRLVYHKLPAALSCEQVDAFHLQEEIRQAILEYVEILHVYPVAVYLSDMRLAQITRFGFGAYFVRSEQQPRAIPFRRAALADGIIVCASA